MCDLTSDLPPRHARSPKITDDAEAVLDSLPPSLAGKYRTPMLRVDAMLQRYRDPLAPQQPSRQEFAVALGEVGRLDDEQFELFCQSFMRCDLRRISEMLFDILSEPSAEGRAELAAWIRRERREHRGGRAMSG